MKLKGRGKKISRAGWAEGGERTKGNECITGAWLETKNLKRKKKEEEVEEKKKKKKGVVYTLEIAFTTQSMVDRV